MKITLYANLKKFTLTSSLKKEEMELAKKYAPDALKIKDDDGNDVFAVGYTPAHSNICAKSVTFGDVDSAGNVFLVGDVPGDLAKDREKAGEYVADVVGVAMPHLKLLEERVPAEIGKIRETRSEVISGIVSAE